MFQYCPSCGSRNIQYKGNRFNCPECGFVYYHNTATATGCIIETGGKVLFLVRGMEPSMGKLDLPGGFVDPGEGLLEGLCRELREELGWEPPLLRAKPAAHVFKFFASFPNAYPYKNILYNTCDIYFTVSVPGLSEKDFNPQEGEITTLKFLQPGKINPEDLAFDSTRRVITAFITQRI